MPNLVIVAQNAELQAVSTDDKPGRLRIAMTGQAERPGSSIVYSFQIRHGNERRADGWAVPVDVLLCRASPADAYIPQESMSGKTLVGMLFAGWTEAGADGGAERPWLQMRLSLPPEHFDALAALLPQDLQWRICVGAASWYPTPILRRGLTHSHDPDGRDMVWDTAHASQTELETFLVSVGPKPIVSVWEMLSGDLKSLNRSIEQTFDAQRQANRWVHRTFWLVLVLGTLILLATLGA